MIDLLSLDCQHIVGVWFMCFSTSENQKLSYKVRMKLQVITDIKKFILFMGVKQNVNCLSKIMIPCASAIKFLYSQDGRLVLFQNSSWALIYFDQRQQKILFLTILDG